MTDLEIKRVKDKQEAPVKVYELIERKGEIPGIKRELLDVYEDGLSEYRKKMAKGHRPLRKSPEDRSP